MSKDVDSSPDVAAARIWATYEAVKALHQRTGGDPAEAMFELLVVCCLISHEARPMRAVKDIIADATPHAEACALDWFADKIARWRRGNA